MLRIRTPQLGGGTPVAQKISVNVSGVWKQATISVNVAGVWEQVVVSVNVGGVWKNP